jgi:hypothetical protein
MSCLPVSRSRVVVDPVDQLPLPRKAGGTESFQYHDAAGNGLGSGAENLFDVILVVIRGKKR